MPDGPSDGIKKYEILYTLDKTKPLSKWEVREVDGEADVGMVRIKRGGVETRGRHGKDKYGRRCGKDKDGVGMVRIERRKCGR